MEQKQKRRITVDIAGVTLTLITDENDMFVDGVVSQVSERMERILAGGIRTGTSTVDAALLCAIDAAGERLKAEKRIRNLEAQISLYEVNLRNLREELDKLTEKAAADAAKPKEGEADDGFTRLSEMLRAGGEAGAEDKIRSLERYLESKKNGQEAGMTRSEKIRYIESLLRGSD